MRRATKIIKHALGHRQPTLGLKTVNPPVYRGSTFTYDNFDQVRDWLVSGAQDGRIGYGRSGTDITVALEDLVAQLEGGTEGIATPSGAAAIALAMSAFVEAGDQILIADNVYDPGRHYADNFLARFGVTVTYFDPLDLDALPTLITDRAKVLFFEVPGSMTFEMPDADSLYAIARKHDLISIVDNTWPTALYYPAIERGADVSLAAGTKYYVGHSDAFFGIVVGNERTGKALRRQASLMGNHMGPDDVYLALRGMRTLEVRMKAIEASALAVAKFLDAHPKIAEVRHPALPSCPGHEFWKAQFDGASGLFGAFLADAYTNAQCEALIESLEHFAIGFSWGGFESLAVQKNPARTASDWQGAQAGKGPLIRFQIGLEDTHDLIDDLSAALDRLP